MGIDTTFIEDYFNQNLSEDDRRTFENRLKSDNDFAQKVKSHALLINAFDELQALELIANLNKIEAELEGETEKSSFHPMLKWAAIFALFMMISTWFIWNKQQCNEELFIAYYTIYPNVETPIVRSDANQQGAWRLYSSGNYEDAYQQFQHSIGNGQNDEATWFYLGACALELNRYNQAEKAFKQIIEQNGDRYTEQANWYLALTYLKADKKAKSISLLQKIEQSNSSYAKKATELLGELQ